MHSEQGNVKIFAGKTGHGFAKKMCNVSCEQYNRATLKSYISLTAISLSASKKQ